MTPMSNQAAPVLDPRSDIADLTAAIVDIESVSGNEKALADAVEAALRPTMRFVEPKSAEQQARAVAFRTREQLVKQRTEAVNSLRSHLYEFGHTAPEGIGYLPRLAKIIEDPGSNVRCI